MALSLCVWLLGGAGSAAAGSTTGDGATAHAATATVTATDGTTAADADAPTFRERLGDTLRRIPLRPVRIGTTPRLPDDPEPGMGVVVRLRF